MKKNRKLADRFWIGLLVGVIICFVMIVVFLSSNHWELQDFGKVMKYLGRDSYAALKLTLLCMLPCSMLAFLSYRLELWDTFKGLMVITMLSIVPFFLFLV